MEITSSGSSMWEIEEEISNDGLHELALESIKEDTEVANSADGDHNNVYYVAILGKNREEEFSMDALLWTLNTIIPMDPSPLLYLIHVFPELHVIPTPLGKLPISQVNPDQKEKYLIQERGKRRDFLQKFLNICSASKVEVETIMIESDMEAKAILDLIPILNIRKLVLGASKSTLRKMRSRKGRETADQMLQKVPESCDLSIICEGKLQVFDQTSSTPSLSPSPSSSPSQKPHNKSNGNTTSDDNSSTIAKLSTQEQVRMNETFTCGCFK